MTFPPDQTPQSADAHDGDAATVDLLAGRRILIVEDDPLIALALEEILTEQGLVIAGTARDVGAALRLAASAPIDVALLDVNVGSEKIDPVANLLASRCCPFVFATGYGRIGLPEAHRSRPIVEKPFYIDEIIDALRNELTRELERS
ncbi:MAG: response regulator [Methylocystis sp.]|nr:response regulator [Methylocystis sp.]